MNKIKKNKTTGSVAQWLERRTHNPLVLGSNPNATTSVFFKKGEYMEEEKEKLEFIKEFTNVISNKFSVRVYRNRFNPTDLTKPITEYRYHFGFPKELIEPIALLLETTCYWGEQHWKEEDNCFIYWTTIVEKADKNAPIERLKKEICRFIDSANNCLSFLRKAITKP